MITHRPSPLQLGNITTMSLKLMKAKICTIGQIWKSEANGLVYHRGGVSPAICCGQHSGVQPKILETMSKIYRIRKLTPRECFRLMGVNDEDINKINEAGISESQQYKMAGNSIVVNVLEGIFTQLFKSETDTLF